MSYTSSNLVLFSRKWTFFSNNTEEAPSSSCSSRAFIWVVTSFRFTFRIQKSAWFNQIGRERLDNRKTNDKVRAFLSYQYIVHEFAGVCELVEMFCGSCRNQSRKQRKQRVTHSKDCIQVCVVLRSNVSDTMFIVIQLILIAYYNSHSKSLVK